MQGIPAMVPVLRVQLQLDQYLQSVLGQRLQHSTAQHVTAQQQHKQDMGFSTAAVNVIFRVIGTLSMADNE
jgi:hypothetical protein